MVVSSIPHQVVVSSFSVSRVDKTPCEACLQESWTKCNLICQCDPLNIFLVFILHAIAREVNVQSVKLRIIKGTVCKHELKNMHALLLFILSPFSFCLPGLNWLHCGKKPKGHFSHPVLFIARLPFSPSRHVYIHSIIFAIEADWPP